MPILEYSCKACGHQFEFLKLPATTDAPLCPECRSDALERVISGFAMTTPEMSKARVKAARKQRLGSKDYKDKQIADAEELKHHH